jgi:hypothetical protein
LKDESNGNSINPAGTFPHSPAASNSHRRRCDPGYRVFSWGGWVTGTRAPSPAEIVQFDFNSLTAISGVPVAFSPQGCVCGEFGPNSLMAV